MSQWEHFNLFKCEMKARLEMGEKKYGQEAHVEHDLIQDVKEELIDLANYAYLMYNRVKKLEVAYERRIQSCK